MTATQDPQAPTDREEFIGEEMSLVEHLAELRSRLIKSALAVVAGFVVGFVLFQPIFDLLIRPYCGLPDELRAASNVFDPTACKLIFTQPLGAFFVTLKTAAIVAVALGAPIVFYQIWRFVTPGLRPVERRYAVPFLVLSQLLFAGGAVFAYFVIPRGLEFLLSFAGDNIVALLDASEYIGFILKTMLGFGISFEFPLIIAMLVLSGAIGHEGLRKYRRHAYFGSFVLAAVITPTQDPFTMTVMAGPLALFYEADILFARFVERRRRTKLV